MCELGGGQGRFMLQEWAFKGVGFRHITTIHGLQFPVNIMVYIHTCPGRHSPQHMHFSPSLWLNRSVFTILYILFTHYTIYSQTVYKDFHSFTTLLLPLLCCSLISWPVPVSQYCFGMPFLNLCPSYALNIFLICICTCPSKRIVIVDLSCLIYTWFCSRLFSTCLAWVTWVPKDGE